MRSILTRSRSTSPNPSWRRCLSGVLEGRDATSPAQVGRERGRELCLHLFFFTSKEYITINMTILLNAAT